MASDIKWIKIVTDLFDDEKIQLIEALPESDTVITIWFKLLCLAGKCNNSGLLTIMDKIPYTENMLAHIFRRKEASVHLALETFVNFGMVEVIDGVYAIHNWEKHQQLDKLEQIREQNRVRVAEYRERQKLALEDKTSKTESKTKKCNVTVTKNVTQCNALESSYSLSSSISNSLCNEDSNKLSINDVINLYNDNTTSFPKVSRSNEKRNRAINKLLSQKYTKEDFITVFTNAEHLGFLLGDNDRGWKADFDFLMREEPFQNILEGGSKYNTSKSSSKQWESHVCNDPKAYETYDDGHRGIDFDKLMSESGR